MSRIQTLDIPVIKWCIMETKTFHDRGRAKTFKRLHSKKCSICKNMYKTMEDRGTNIEHIIRSNRRSPADIRLFNSQFDRVAIEGGDPITILSSAINEETITEVIQRHLEESRNRY